jgi:hypothetical protein
MFIVWNKYNQVTHPLYPRYAPNTANVVQRSMWNSVMAEGFVLLARLDATAAVAALPPLCAQLLECFATDRKELVVNAAAAFTRVVTDVLGRSPDSVEAALAVADAPVAKVCCLGCFQNKRFK